MPERAQASSLFKRGWTALCRPLIVVLNAAFRPAPADGSIGAWKILAWIIMNCVALYAALTFTGGTVKPALIGAFLLLHILIILSSLRIMSEEKKVLEGSLAPDRMTFSVFDAVNSAPLLSASIAFYVLGLPALIGVIEDGGIAKILSRRPSLPTVYAANLTCVLNEVPVVSQLMRAAANLSGLSENLNADIAYSGIIGNIIQLLIVATVGFIIVQAIVLRLQQASHRLAILASIGKPNGYTDQLHARLLRLPRAFAERLKSVAALEKDTSLQHHIQALLQRFGHHK